MLVGLYGEPSWLPMTRYAEGLAALGVSFRWRSVDAWSGDGCLEDCFTTVVTYGQRGKQREMMLAYQRRGVPVVVIEHGFLRRSSPGTFAGYWYVGLNGLHDIPPDPQPYDRLISLRLNETTRAQRETGCAVILGQTPNDASHGLDEHQLRQAYERMVRELQDARFSRVLFRPHPLAKPSCAPGGVPVSIGPLDEVLSRVDFALTLNSNAGLDAILAGVPAAAKLPCHWSEISSPWPVQHPGRLSFPGRLELSQFLARLAYAQWTLDELATGKPHVYLSHRGLVK